MKATEAMFLGFLKRSPQFIIPIYQRTYSWNERHCRRLWDDIIRAGSKDAISAHFIGSIVYIEQGLYQVSSQSSLLVIDGQQRLTSVILILEALARHLSDEEPLDGFSAKKLRDYYLLDPREDGDRRFKLLLTQTDKTSLLALIQQKSEPDDPSLRISKNFEFFEEQVRGLDGDLTVLCRGLAKLAVVDISLNRIQDNPQLIFESMNSTGEDLSQADLIRNFVLMDLEHETQTRLYEDYWRPMEARFGQEGYSSHFDGFMKHYLTLKTREIPNVRAVYQAFKTYAQDPEVATGGVDALVADIHSFAGYYCTMALGQETNQKLAEAFQDLRELKVEVAYPLLLELYDDFKQGRLSADDLVRAVRLIEAYVFRRVVCSIPTNSLNKTFATFGRMLKKDQYLESMQAHFLNLPSYRRFPMDEEFKRELTKRDLYNFLRRRYWLRRLENHGRKEQAIVDDYTIEHILPQNENLSAEWRENLGSEWQRVQETWLHTLGNLTLTGYNAEYGDKSFAEKRDMEGGFKNSPLNLNKGLGSLEKWDETAIKNRAEQLAQVATKVWTTPSLNVDMLASVLPVNLKSGNYSIDDHEYLVSSSHTRELFEIFRKEVLALNPCVSEEFLKLYVAYKAETNFVDAVPQKNGLRLSLNMRFHELHDPKGFSKDITNLGRWGNGDVEIHLSNADELPYVMGLVRQAFEKQMGNSELDE